MALTIKNPETVYLACTLARQTGLTQTGAITLARRRQLVTAGDDGTQRRHRAEKVLKRIWQELPTSDADRIEQNLDS